VCAALGQITADVAEDTQRELREIWPDEQEEEQEGGEGSGTGAVAEEREDEWDFVWYPNPKPTIAQEESLFHVQVFWTHCRHRVQRAGEPAAVGYEVSGRTAQRPGTTWVCKACTLENEDSAVICAACGAPRAS
jgi:hypothetical protein